LKFGKELEGFSCGNGLSGGSNERPQTVGDFFIINTRSRVVLLAVA
jgi:hypothetical protein